jgi:hypothetical protein
MVSFRELRPLSGSKRFDVGRWNLKGETEPVPERIVCNDLRICHDQFGYTASGVHIESVSGVRAEQKR